MDCDTRDRAYFDALMKDARDGILVFDVVRDADRSIISFACKTASLSCESLVGSGLSELEGKKLDEIFPDDLAARLFEDLKDAANRREVFDNFERHEMLDGDHWLHVMARPLDEQTVLLILVDASASRRFNLRMKELRQELDDIKASNKRVFSTLSYEMRTPLNTVIGFADMIVGEMFGPLEIQQYKDYVTDIARSGRHMLKTVDNLLEQEMVKDLVKEGKEYRSIIELAPDMMSLCRDGVIEMINPAGASMLGVWPVGKLEGRNLSDFVHPDYRELFETGLDAIADEGHRVPCKLLNAKGEAIDTELSAIPYQIPGERQAVMLVARDVRDIKKANEEIVARELRLRQIMDTVADAIISCDQNGTIESFNMAAEGIFGYKADEIVGKSIGLLMPDQVDQKPVSVLDRAVDQTKKWGGLTDEDSRARRKDGTVFPSDISVSTLDTGQRRIYIAVVRDVTQRKRAEERLQFLATRDPLTGLPNRALFQVRLEQAINKADRNGKHVAILFVDLDQFKRVNDAMGHAVGDRVLQAAGERMVNCVRLGDTVARLSADEFTIILDDLDDTSLVPETGDKILTALSNPFEVDGKQIFTSGTIGAIIYPQDADNIEDLFKNADMAHAYAKKIGRNTLQQYTEHLSSSAIRRMQVETELRTAIDKGELELFFQPQVDLSSHKVIGCEALLRWNNGILGPIGPDEFIPVAEETGMIVPIGEWVLRDACRRSAEWQKQGLPDIRVAVNMSARQFKHQGLADTVADILDDTGLPARFLELELTESILVEDPTSATETLTALKKLGLEVSIDDFGTGYSSLSYLRQFPIDALKVDRSFVLDIPEDSNAMAITRAIIGLAKSLGLKTVAEGLEDSQQVMFLNALDCEIGQGYFFSKPVAADEFTKLLAEKGGKLRPEH